MSFRTAKGVIISVVKNGEKKKIEGLYSFDFPLPQLSTNEQYFLRETVPYVISETLSAESLQISCYLDYTDETHIWLIQKMYDTTEVEFHIDFPTGGSCVFWGYVSSAPVSTNITTADSMTLNVTATRQPEWEL